MDDVGSNNSSELKFVLNKSFILSLCSNAIGRLDYTGRYVFIPVITQTGSIIFSVSQKSSIILFSSFNILYIKIVIYCENYICNPNFLDSLENLKVLEVIFG